MKRNFTISDLKNSAVAAINPHVFEKVSEKKKRKEAKRLTDMKNSLRVLNIEFEEEYRFSERKFRFDIAFPDKKIAAEYEGIKSNKSRHTSLTGYSKDTEKYNLASSLGWTVLRYTVLTYKNFIQDILKLIQ